MDRTKILDYNPRGRKLGECNEEHSANRKATPRERVERTYQYIEEMIRAGIEFRPILGNELYELMDKAFIEHVPVKQISVEYGVSESTIRSRLYGSKGSVYSKLQYWKGRVNK